MREPTQVASRRLRPGGVETFLYDAGGGDVPVVCVHGNPDSAEIWLPLLRAEGRLGRVIAPDLPGWGRSPAPARSVCDGSAEALDEWFEALLSELGVDRLRLVVHDWGGLALAAAARRAGQLERLVLIDAVPLSDSYRWHFVARHLWRRRGVGEIAAPLHVPSVVWLVAALQQPGWRGPHRDWRTGLRTSLNPDTPDSILRLYRSAEPEVLARLGSGLSAITCPVLIVRGEGDPYIGARDMDDLAARLGGPVERWEVPGAGHWSMYDTPCVFERVLDFLAPSPPG